MILIIRCKYNCIVSSPGILPVLLNICYLHKVTCVAVAYRIFYANYFLTIILFLYDFNNTK